MEVNDQLNAPSRLTPGERASVAYLIGPQSLHGHGGEEKKKFLLCPVGKMIVLKCTLGKGSGALIYEMV
jgi:hypothetical protein